MDYSKFWSEAEIEWLKTNYPRMGLEYCAKKLNRERPSIRMKASRLGLRQDKTSKFFKEWQKRAAQSKVGKKRPEHSAHMKKLASLGLVGWQRGYGIKHGLSQTKAYKIWKGMIERCYYPSSNSYHNYGGRGITVCDEWQKLETFKEWFDKNYKEGLSIERIDVDGNYEPSNCTFANQTQQARNRRTTKLNIEIAGKIRSMHKRGINQREIGRKLGIDFKQINNIVLNKSWVVENDN